MSPRRPVLDNQKGAHSPTLRLCYTHCSTLRNTKSRTTMQNTLQHTLQHILKDAHSTGAHHTALDRKKICSLFSETEASKGRLSLSSI